jgi:hypothetical protein
VSGVVASASAKFRRRRRDAGANSSVYEVQESFSPESLDPKKVRLRFVVPASSRSTKAVNASIVEHTARTRILEILQVGHRF